MQNNLRKIKLNSSFLALLKFTSDDHVVHSLNKQIAEHVKGLEVLLEQTTEQTVLLMALRDLLSANNFNESTIQHLHGTCMLHH